VYLDKKFMQSFGKICEKDIKWRLQEIALIRKSTVLMDASDELRAVLRRYSVPALYAVWEGFIVIALSECAKQINRKRISVGKANSSVVRHNVFDKFQLNNIPTHLNKQSELVLNIYRYFQGKLILNSEIHTNSNVDFNELKKLMSHYGVDFVDDCNYKSRLSKFLNYRNRIAHGNNGVEVNDVLIKEFADLIEELMDRVLNELVTCLKCCKYLKDS
jgi:hypothetical protein